MLQAFREHKRWLMMIAMVLVIPSFVVTGIYSYNRMTQADNSIAKIGNDSIAPEQFDQAKRVQLERLREQLGPDFRAGMLDTEESRQAIVTNLMNESAVSQTVRSEFIQVSEAEAVALIKNADALKENGKFSPALYQRFLQSQGKSDEQFVQEVRRDLSREVLTAGVASSYPVPEKLVQRFYDILTERREVSLMPFDPADFTKGITVTEAEMQAYYDSHKSDFTASEHVNVEYVTLSPDNFKASVKPNEEDIRSYYEQNKNRWTASEQRDASHILIGFGSDKAEAKKKAEDILAKVKANPADFGKLAAEYSEDPGSAADEGRLGLFGRGAMVAPFETAVFGAKKGDIVGPVETEYGWHLIRLNDVQPEHVRSFDEVRAEIENEYKDQTAMREYAEKAEDFTNMVYEQSDSLAPVADKFGLEIKKLDNVTREGTKDEALKKIFNDHLVDNLFGDECLKEKRNSSAVEVAPNLLVSARVDKYVPAAVRPFAEVKAEIAALLSHQKASELARAAGEKKLAAVTGSKSLDGFAPALWIGRQDAQGYSAELVDTLIAYPADKLPAYVGRQLEDGRYMLAYVSKAEKRTAKPEELASLRREISRIYGSAQERGYLAALRTKLEAKILRPDFIAGEKKDAE